MAHLQPEVPKSIARTCCEDDVNEDSLVLLVLAGPGSTLGGYGVSRTDRSEKYCLTRYLSNAQISIVCPRGIGDCIYQAKAGNGVSFG